MAKESNLKKEFAQKDVSRMRNLLTGKTGDRTGIQSGYEKSRQDHKEGDEWEENGKLWTIKNGIKQTVTKFDSLKRLVNLPYKCPSCNNPMSLNEINKKMYSIHNECFECVIQRETKLKIEGKYSGYENNMLNLNKDSLLEDFELALESWINEKDSFVSEDGVVESWSNTNNDKEVYKEIKERVKKLKEEKI
jgi:putative component of toxin-antitoxin plasmid stabilization module